MAINKKFIGLLIVSILLLGGCGGQTAQYPQRSADLPTTADKQMAGLDQIISEPNIKSENLAHNENIQELKHLKYGTRPGGGSGAPPANTDESVKTPATSLPRTRATTVDEPYTQVNIQLLTIEELDAVIEALIKLGYLQQKPANEEELSNALVRFQGEHNLTPSGKLDDVTLQLILN